MKNFIVSIFVFGISFLSWGQGEFVTVWDHNYAFGGGIYFDAVIDPSGANYTWQVLPNGVSGSGTLAGGTGLKFIGNLPTGVMIKLSIEPKIYYFHPATLGSAFMINDVESWGSTPWISMEGMFMNCPNLNVSATDVPNLSNVSSLKWMFFTVI